MRVLDRKLLRDLVRSKGMLAAVASIVALGITCFVGMASLHRNLERSRRAYYAQCRMADFTVDVKRMPLAEVARIERLPGVLALRARIATAARVDLQDASEPVSGLLLSLPDEPGPVVNDVVLRQGSRFTPGGRNEVLVGDAFARARGIRPGDRLRLLAGGRLHDLRVAGTAIGAEFTYLVAPGAVVPDPRTYGVFYVKRSDAQDLLDFAGACNQVLGVLDPRTADRPEETLREIERLLEEYGVEDTTPRSRQASHVFLTSEIEGLRVSSRIVPAIFLGVAAAVLNVLMMRLAEQERTVVGTLQALGYRNRTIALHFVKYGAAVGLAGGLLGAVGGWLLAGAVTRIYVQFYEFPKLDNVAYPDLVAGGFVLSVAAATAGTLRGAWSVMRVRPAEAMRPKPPAHGRHVLPERWPLVRRMLGFRGRMVLRNVLRHRTRTLSGLLAAAVGAMLMMVTFGSRDSLRALIEQQFDRLLLSDYDLALTDAHDLSVLQEAQLLPGTDRTEAVFDLPCTLRRGAREKRTSITGLREGVRLTVPRDADGRPASLPATGLLLTRRLAEDLDVPPGGEVEVVPVRGRREPRRTVVAGIVDGYMGPAAYAAFDEANRLAGEAGAVDRLQSTVSSAAGDDERFRRSLADRPAIRSVASIRREKRTLQTVLIDKMLASVFVIVGFAACLSCGSVVNSSLIALAERRQEVATLRALGWGPYEVGRLFLLESVLVHGTGTLIGLPLGWFATKGLMRMYDTELFRLPFVLEPASWGTTLALGLGFVLVAHLPVQRAIGRMDWLGALNAKE